MSEHLTPRQKQDETDAATRKQASEAREAAKQEPAKGPPSHEETVKSIHGHSDDKAGKRPGK